VWRTGVDHESGSFIINGRGNEKMISETSLQRRAAKPFAREKRPQRSFPGIRRLLGSGRPDHQEDNANRQPLKKSFHGISMVFISHFAS
jgi:hypothetical protein